MIPSIKACGVTVTVYEYKKGEFLPWHRHPNMHGHVIVRGRTLVEIDSEPSFEMIPGMANVELPANIWHKITALEDDTIFIHISDTYAFLSTELKPESN